MATKITAIVSSSFDDDDLVSIVRTALLQNHVEVESVDATRLYDNAVLYVDLGMGRRKYVLAIPSRGDHIDWTDDIDAAKTCTSNRQIEQCKAEVQRRVGIKVDVLAI